MRGVIYPRTATGSEAIKTRRCAGTARPYRAGTYRPASRTGQCPECLQHIGVTATSTLKAHTTTGGLR